MKLSETAVILAGGRSSRFGSPKSLALFHGKRVIDREIEILTSLFSQVLIVTGRDQSDLYKSCGIPIVYDRKPDRGPMEGIRTALSEAQSKWVFVVGCDFPLLDAACIASMAPIEGDTNTEAMIPVFNERDQYLHAVYKRSLKGPMDRFIQSGGRALKDFFWERSRIRRVPCEGPSCLSFNTRDELHRTEAFGIELSLAGPCGAKTG